MAGKILTPLSIWNNFSVEGKPYYEVVEERQFGDMLLERIYLNGRKTKEGQVKILVTTVRKIKVKTMPAVLILNDFGGDGESLAIDFAKNGYFSVSVDLAGECEGKFGYTYYPKDIEYSNYFKNKDTTFIASDVRGTCYYEWGCVCRYVIDFIKSRGFVTKIGGLGLGKAANVLWHLAATTNDIDASVFVSNAGWSAYKGTYKFDSQVEPRLSDDMLKFIAGVEPQSFAQHIKSPVLMLSPLISNEYDCDRAHDTVDRISRDVYSAVYFSPEFSDAVNENAYKSMFIFFSNVLGDENNLPKEPEIKCNIVNCTMEVEVNVGEKNLKELSLYVSEEILDPSCRAWSKISNYKEIENGKAIFNYGPYKESGAVMFFATAEYKDGYSISSNIICKKFSTKEVSERNASRIVYSSREKNSESVFLSLKNSLPLISHFEMSNTSGIFVKNGPMGIQGVYSPKGLKTHKINSKKDKPAIDSLLMFDVFVKEEADLKISLEGSSKDKPIFYSTIVHVNGGKIWHNVKIEMNKFKTEDGKLLKSFEDIKALYFIISGEYLINNILWV